ncbi:glutamate 5-kinase [Stieleria varia]|uniref:Glutamate 5-kinase n=1 Tax=Stieleria varia TaxID=2528005 RepID=A0A5C6B019_9BACT|nr:glutamate 5-kinase [Stieleria varia]TWU05117.1 Glutamate 5-kinase [Stieleria varia]
MTQTNSFSDSPPSRRDVIAQAKSIVVKVGTRVLTDSEGKLDRHRIALLSQQLCRIADTGRQTVMVSSGAVGAGMGKLGLEERPSGLAQLQAVAAVGQTDLIQAYETAISAQGRHAAQVLLTSSDLRRRSGYLHVRNALTQIHDFGAIAVVNENDSVAVAELMTTFGDNDRMAAQVAGLLSDCLLIILSDIDGLYTGPPTAPGSKLVPLVEHLDDSVFALAADSPSSAILDGPTSQAGALPKPKASSDTQAKNASPKRIMSKGGMTSKLKAAQLATSHGHNVIIGPGRKDDVLDQIMAGQSVGTLFLAPTKSIRGRRRWISASAPVAGALSVDAGAAKAVTVGGGSLLAIGIKAIEGRFSQGAVVSIRDPNGHEIARGLCNYPSDELAKILGSPSDQIGEILGHRPYESVVHRSNLVLS